MSLMKQEIFVYNNITILLCWIISTCLGRQEVALLAACSGGGGGGERGRDGDDGDGEEGEGEEGPEEGEG